MANVKTDRIGRRFEPQSADPINPSEGQTQYADGTARAKGLWTYDGTTWVSGSGGGGGALNFYPNGDADAVADTSNETTGNNATFDGGGTLQGTYSISTAANDLIRGQNVRKLVLNATPGTSDNDYVASESISIPLGYRGRTLGTQFQYKYDGADNDIKVVILDDTNTEILQEVNLEAFSSSNTAKEAKIHFICPTDCEAIKVGFQVNTHATGSEVLIWDDQIVNNDALFIKEILNTESWQNTGETITIEGLTSDPTKASNLEEDSIFYARKGNIGSFKYTYRTGATATGAENGSGNYLYSLPLGLKFNNNLVDFYTDNITGGNDTLWRGYGTGGGVDDASSSVSSIQIIPYDFRRFRIVIIAGTFAGAIGSAAYNATNVNMGWNVEFDVPIAGWEETTTNFISNATVGANFEVVGNIEIEATTTNPTKASNLIKDQVSLKRNANIAALEYLYRSNTTTPSAVIGSGDYLYKLPVVNGVQLEFDDTQIDFYTTVPGPAALTAIDYLRIGKGFGTIDGVASIQNVGIIPFNSTSFRICYIDTNNLVRFFSSSVGFAATTQVNNGWRITFEVPIKDWTIENQVTLLQPVVRTAILKDIQTSGTTGGASVAGVYTTRRLNTIEGDSSFVSLSSNQFILQPGTYEINATCPQFNVGAGKAKLRNITDSVDTALGQTSATFSTSNDSSIINAIFTITSPKTFEIQHRTASSVVNGFGAAVSYGDDEVYTQVKINKLK
jgi:hypothetical protein